VVQCSRLIEVACGLHGTDASRVSFPLSFLLSACSDLTFSLIGSGHGRAVREDSACHILRLQAVGPRGGRGGRRVLAFHRLASGPPCCRAHERGGYLRRCA
jgi:hypothetical protein